MQYIDGYIVHISHSYHQLYHRPHRPYFLSNSPWRITQDWEPKKGSCGIPNDSAEMVCRWVCASLGIIPEDISVVEQKNHSRNHPQDHYCHYLSYSHTYINIFIYKIKYIHIYIYIYILLVHPSCHNFRANLAKERCRECRSLVASLPVPRLLVILAYIERAFFSPAPSAQGWR